ncbi:NEAT domain-containing protein [Paenibacillus validus]|uniref:NEAT domain-containing protein n=1 Tax=Paenibacillus validus TaxID=44253 RepID=UPI003D2B8E12
MTKQIQKTMAIWLAFVLLLSALQIGSVSAAETSSIVPDGEYAIGYRYVKDTNHSEVSAANAYMLPNTGKLIIQNGHAKFENQITKENYATFAYFGSRMAGRDKAVIHEEVGKAPVVTGIEGYKPVVTRLTEDGRNVIVQMEIEDISKIQDLLLHVDDKDNIFKLPVPYNYWYHVGLELDISQIVIPDPGNGEGGSGDPGNGGDNGNEPVTLAMFNELATVARSVYASTYEGTGDGYYPVGSKAEFYLSITQSETIAANAGGEPTIIKAAYYKLKAALDKYNALKIVVDKAPLIQLIEEIRAFTQTAKDGGAAEGGPGNQVVYALSENEYPYPTVQGFVNRTQAASNVVADVYASPEDVSKQYNNLYNGDSLTPGFKDIQKRKFVASAVNILILDSDTDTATESVYANEFKHTATILQQAEDPYYQAYANITFVNPAGELDVKRLSPNAAGSYGTSYSLAASAVKNQSDAQNKVYQPAIRYASADDSKWRGLTGLRYTVNGVTKTVYISFNADQLAALNNSVAYARQLHEGAVEGTEPGQYQAGAKATLLEAIELAAVTGSKLAASRPQIADASAKLQAAVDAFQASVIPANPDPGTGNPNEYPIGFTIYKKGTDQNSVMYDYVDRNSGKLVLENDKYYVSFTLKQSKEVVSFKTKQNGVLQETETVSTDEAANTRTVRFEVEDLTARKDGWVKIYWQITDSYLYDHEYDVELGFSNLPVLPVSKTTLNSKITEAEAKYQAAAEGSSPGQYAAGAKAALQKAIDTAKDVSSSTTATQQAVNEAVNALKKALVIFNASEILADASYTFSLPAMITDATGAPISNYVSSGAKFEVSSGKQVATFELKAGVKLKKIQMKKADGSLEDVEKVAAAAKQAGVVTVLSADGAAAAISFEVKDRTAVYVLSLVDADQTERAFEIAFAEVALVPPPTTNPEGPGGGGPGSGGPGGGGTTPNIHGIPDGTYSIAYRFLKYNTNETSVMQDYVITPGRLTVQNGTMFVEITLQQSKEVTDFKIDNGGGMSTPEVSQTDEEKNTRTVKFQVNDLTEKLKGWVKIYWQVSPDFLYDHEYDVHLTFDKSTIKAIASGANPAQDDANKPFLEKYTEGEYAIEYALNLRGSKQTSVTNDYVKHPAKLVLKEGKSYLVVTVSNKEVTGLKIEKDGVLTDAEVVSTNEQRNERTLQFEVKDTKTKIFAQFILAVPGKYNGEYNVEFVLDGNSVKPYKEQPSDNGQIKPGKQQGVSGIFADLEDHWAKAAIERAVGLGIVNGYEDGTFRPDAEINRAEFTTLLSRTLKLVPSTEELSFTDLENIPEWVKPHLAPVVQAGIIGGYEDGSFRAERKISRAELAVIIVRALKLDVEANAQSTFEDAGSIPQWAHAEVAAANELGIISGRDNNLFAPNESATRAEAVTLILALNNYVK